ncbi:MAG: hypothetical protein ACP5D7_12705 [Limnospira sp.]
MSEASGDGLNGARNLKNLIEKQFNFPIADYLRAALYLGFVADLTALETLSAIAPLPFYHFWMMWERLKTFKVEKLNIFHPSPTSRCQLPNLQIKPRRSQSISATTSEAIATSNHHLCPTDFP